MNRRIASLENTAETDVRFRRQHTTPRRGHDIVPDNSIGQQMAGNLAIQRLFRSGSIQAKLAISQPNDLYEQEANRIADQVVSSPPVGIIHHKCAACEAGGTTCPKCKEEGKLGRKEKPGHPPQAPSEIHSQIVGLRGGGQPLPLSVRAFFEPRFGRDFSQVRVHTDARAAHSAQALQARAYTVGRDVVFGFGQYSPDTGEGRRLLAHELVHTLQSGTQGTPSAAYLREECYEVTPRIMEAQFSETPSTNSEAGIATEEMSLQKLAAPDITLQRQANPPVQIPPELLKPCTKEQEDFDIKSEESAEAEAKRQLAIDEVNYSCFLTRIACGGPIATLECFNALVSGLRNAEIDAEASLQANMTADKKKASAEKSLKECKAYVVL